MRLTASHALVYHVHVQQLTAACEIKQVLGSSPLPQLPKGRMTGIDVVASPTAVTRAAGIPSLPAAAAGAPEHPCLEEHATSPTATAALGSSSDAAARLPEGKEKLAQYFGVTVRPGSGSSDSPVRRAIGRLNRAIRPPPRRLQEGQLTGPALARRLHVLRSSTAEEEAPVLRPEPLTRAELVAVQDRVSLELRVSTALLPAPFPSIYVLS